MMKPRDEAEHKLRVLVVEDEPMIAMMIEDSIEALGYQIIGPVALLDEALALAAKEGFDCAILDINIRGGNSYAVADMLLTQGCPFVLATGYGNWSLPKHLACEKRLTKPYSSDALEAELRLLCDRVQLNMQGRNDTKS
jgi:CheY-like chemotaxis protein